VPDDPERLPDEAVVVRGGLLSSESMDTSVNTHFDEFGEYALSVSCRPGLTADGIAQEAGIPHPKLRESTVGAIRAIGYDVLASEQHGPAHAEVAFSYPPGDADWEALQGVFGPARPNPARKAK
jgi:hypothetical protein